MANEKCLKQNHTKLKVNLCKEIIAESLLSYAVGEDFNLFFLSFSGLRLSENVWKILHIIR